MTVFRICALMRSRARLPLLACVCGISFLMGCESPQAGASRVSAVSVDTVNGAVVVRNGPTGLWSDTERWAVRQEYRIGGLDGPHEMLFSGPLMSTSVGPQGQIFVLDFVSDDIKVFDRNGEALRRLGGTGSGPGELNSPVAMGWDSRDRLWVANGFDGRYTVFDSSGTVITTTRRRITAVPRRQNRLTFQGDGSFVDQGFQGSFVTLLRVDSAGGVLDTFPPLRRPDRPTAFIPSGFDRRALRYLPSLVWTVTPQGNVWFAEDGTLRLYQRTLEGDTLRVVQTQHRDHEIDSETKRWLDREFSKLGLSSSDYSLSRPLVQAIHVLDDGHVLVQIVEEVGEGSRLMDVFDPEGRFLGSVRLGFPMARLSVPVLHADTIVAVILDGELDVPYVVRATIQRSGS